MSRPLDDDWTWKDGTALSDSNGVTSSADEAGDPASGTQQFGGGEDQNAPALGGDQNVSPSDLPAKEGEWGPSVTMPTSSTTGSSPSSAIATSSSATTTAASDRTNPNTSTPGDSALVTFNSTNFQPGGQISASGRVFDVNDDYRSFGWAVRDRKVELLSVSMLSWNAKSGSDDDTLNKVIAEQRFPDAADRKRASGKDPESRAGAGALTILESGGGAQIDLSYFDEGAELDTYRAQQMAIQLYWAHEGDRGWTRSGVFTVADPQVDSADLDNFTRFLDREDGEELLKQVEETTQGHAGGASSTSAPSGASTSGAAATGDSDSDDRGGGGGGNGLSTGAIAGISVAGAVVLLALAGGLVFFLCRRRRRQRRGTADPQGSGNAAADSSGAFIPASDKDPHHVVESPRSALSRDPEARQPGHTQPHDRSSEDELASPYRDDAAATTETPPQGVPASVAHLVEDGMTAEEIRRLEEEERQLDDAIERRGRR